MIILYYHIIISYEHNIAFIDTFPVRVFAPEWLHINDLELLRSVPGTEFQRASFPYFQKQLIFIIVGPKAFGALRTLMPIDICCGFPEMILWSGTYLEVFLRYLGGLEPP